MDAPVSLSVTREGQLWATGSQDSVAAVAAYDGRQWSVRIFPELSWGMYRPFETSDGRLWFSGAGDRNIEKGQLGGLLEFDGREWVHHKPPGAPYLSLGAGETADGELWFGAWGWPPRCFAGGAWSDVAGWQDQEADFIDRVHSSRDGHVWIGTRNDGVFRYDGTSWDQWTDVDGLADNDIDRILETSDGTTWLTTRSGVSRFDGKTWTADALPHGLGTILHESQDGAIWINSLGSWGSRLTPGRTPTPFHIQTVRHLPDSQPPETQMVLSARTVSQPGNTTIAWAGLDPWRSTPNEELQYAYRLNDGSWSEFTRGTHKILELVPSGEHNFEVKARDRDFNEDPTPASVKFTVVPPVWREPWFIAMVIVFAGAVGLQTARVIRRDRRLHESNTALSSANKELFGANRDLTVEAALERVRTKALGMHQSEDIANVAVVLFEEVKELGIPIWRSAIEIVDEEEGKGEFWATSAEGELRTGVGYALTAAREHPVFREAHEARKREEPWYHGHFSGNDLLTAARHAVERLNLQFQEWDGQASESLPTALDFYYFFFSNGSLHLALRDPLTEENLGSFRRFAEVFGFAYDRFLELQGKEAQARNAEQRAAVDRVRAEIATMQTSADLEQVTPLIWQELTNLGVPFFRCGVFHVEEEAQQVSVHLAKSDGIPLGAFDVGFDSYPLVSGIVDGWREKRVYVEKWDRQGFLDWLDFLEKQGVPVEREQLQDGPEPPESLVIQAVPFAQGMLYVGSESPLSDEDVTLAKDLTAAFSVAYARHLDFQSLEEQNRAMSEANRELFDLNRALQRERAVERIREQVQTMEEASDFEKVLSLLAEDLKSAGLAFDTCGIDVLDEPVDEPSMPYFEEHGFRYTAYSIDPGGAVTADSYNIPAPFPPVNLETIERFIEGQPWQAFTGGRNAILEVPAAGYGRLRLTASDRREFGETEIETLRDFAGAVALGYARFLDLKAVEAARKREMEELERELQVAHDMQMGLLPEGAPEVPGVELSGICVPANHVGGDYYQYVYLDAEKTQLAVVMADVSGHEMQAATVAMRFNEMLRYEVQDRTNGVEILKGLDGSLKGQIPETMFVTCGVGVLDVEGRSLIFSTAANPEVYHYVKKSDEVRPLGISGCPLGLSLDLGDQVPFNSAEISLSPGDVVVFTSDGVEEAQRGIEEFYEADRLVEVIRATGGQGESADGIRDAIVDDVIAFIGEGPQEDDITVVVMKAT